MASVHKFTVQICFCKCKINSRNTGMTFYKQVLNKNLIENSVAQSDDLLTSVWNLLYSPKNMQDESLQVGYYAGMACIHCSCKYYLLQYCC